MFESRDTYEADFENVRKIGSGQFGTVYQVRNRQSGDTFAAKHVKYVKEFSKNTTSAAKIYDFEVIYCIWLQSQLKLALQPTTRHWTYPFFEDIISYPLSRPKK
jgi:serine/threonine protein kinase